MNGHGDAAASGVRVCVRAMTVDDLELVGSWLHEAHVAPFWSHDIDAELDDMRGELESGGATTYRLGVHDGRPVGLVFWYRIHAYPEYAQEFEQAGVDVPAGAYSFDYLIGEPDALGRGVASAMLRAACDELWATEPDATCLIVPVHADNEQSWRLLERIGFRRLPGVIEMTPDNDDLDGRHVVSQLERPG